MNRTDQFAGDTGTDDLPLTDPCAGCANAPPPIQTTSIDVLGGGFALLIGLGLGWWLRGKK